MTADPIAGCRGERNSLRRFGAFGVTLSNGLQLEDRLPVEIGKTDGQRNQFFTQVKGTVVLCPVVIIVELACQLLSAPPGVSVLVP